VTMEDIIEELVGEIEDEFDPAALPPDASVLDGLLHREELTSRTGIALPPGPYETLGGFVVHSLGRIPAVGDTVTAGEACGELESTKSVSDLYSPVNGEVVEANQDVVDDPALVNSAPFEGGWLFKVRVTDEPEDLMSADEYTAFTAG